MSEIEQQSEFNKAIETMAKDIMPLIASQISLDECTYLLQENQEKYNGMCWNANFNKIAELLYDNGYRKMDKVRKETAKEIFDDIKYGFENTPYYKLNPMLVYELKTILAHIAKKYGIELEVD